jgi:cell division transport system ATP-binding protein
MMIEFRGVQKIYDNKSVAIQDASFKIEQKDFVFFVGPSGAGKSTLLKMVYKAEAPTGGDLLVFGEDVKRIKTKILRRHIGIVFQNYQLLQNKTAYENVAYVMEALGKNPFVTKRATMEALTRLGIDHQVAKYPQQLSGGEQQRVAIARAMVNRPQILICDEPTGSVDPENADGATILMATHNLNIVERMKKKIVLVEDGRTKIKGNL